MAPRQEHDEELERWKKEVYGESVSDDDDGVSSLEGDDQGDGKPALSSSRSTLHGTEEGRSTPFRMSLKEEQERRWSCPPSCPFPTTGRHGFGCTYVHEDFVEDFDIEQNGVSSGSCSKEHKIVWLNSKVGSKIPSFRIGYRRKGDAETCKPLSASETTAPLSEQGIPVLDFDLEQQQNKKENNGSVTPDSSSSSTHIPVEEVRLDRRALVKKRVQICLLAFLALGALALLLVLALPSSIVRFSGNGDPNVEEP